MMRGGRRSSSFRLFHGFLGEDFPFRLFLVTRAVVAVSDAALAGGGGGVAFHSPPLAAEALGSEGGVLAHRHVCGCGSTGGKNGLKGDEMLSKKSRRKD